MGSAPSQSAKPSEQGPAHSRAVIALGVILLTIATGPCLRDLPLPHRSGWFPEAYVKPLEEVPMSPLTPLTSMNPMNELPSR